MLEGIVKGNEENERIEKRGDVLEKLLLLLLPRLKKRHHTLIIQFHSMVILIDSSLF